MSGLLLRHARVGRRRARAVIAGLLGAVVALSLLPAPAPAGGTPPDSTFHVVRFDHRINDGDWARLEDAGARVIDYQPVNGYLVWAGPDVAADLRVLSGVRAVRPVPDKAKIDPGLKAVGGSVAPAAISVYGPAAHALANDIDVFGEVLGVVPTRPDAAMALIAANVDAADLPAIARQPGVLYVSRGSRGLIAEDELTDQVLAGNITKKWEGTAPMPEQPKYPTDGYRDFLDKIKLDGSGIRVAVVDTGIQANHPDLRGRVVERKDYSRVAEPTDTLGHGTHVAGIVGGLPTTPDFSDPDGFTYGLGVAPGVSFVDMNAIALTANFQPPDILPVLAADAWNFGTRLWNASWHTGEGNRAGYLESVRVMDQLARDVLPKEEGREEYLFIFSAGNAGNNGPTVPKEAKNIITVGSTLSGRGVHWPQTTDIDEVSSFSSKGPTKDGRIFPTVSAPGENVISARAPEGVLIAAGCVPALDTATLHTSCSGTSMAAPHVAGAAALLHEWWKKEHGGLPSPPLVKALFVNSATDVGASDIPNNNEGWGRVNLSALFGKTPFVFVDQSVTFSSRGRKFVKTVHVKDARTPLKVTLTWADAPARVDAKRALVNDLDLVVERLDARGGVVASWAGNNFSGGWSSAGGKPDRLNNLENVYLKAPGKGRYRVIVRAFNVPGDGIPENSDATDQDFALVVRGGIAR